jgi:hypothetical protein
MLIAGFQRAGLNRYTGFKSSPYTEGALFFGEKPVDAREAVGIAAQAGLPAAEEPRVECPPGPS